MLTVKDLTDALGLSKYQVRRRIKALDGIIDDHIKRGKKSKLLVNSSGLELLRTLEDLCREGKTIDEAVQEIREDMGESEPSAGDVEDSVVQREPQREGLIEEKDARIEELKEQLEYLRAQIDRKEKQLEEKEEQLERLLPGKVEEKNPEASPWQLLKNWLFSPQ